MSPSSRHEEERYARHFSLKEVGPVGQQKIKSAKVLIVGAGGLGSPISLYLAAAGVGHIGLIDADKVSLSNLQRQILFTTTDIAKSKVQQAQKRLNDMNPEIYIQTYCLNINADNARALIRDYDLVIDGSDNFKTRYCVNDACVLENKPFIFGALYKFEAQISVLHWNDGPCYRCLYPTPPLAEAIPNCSESGVLGVLPGTTGTLMATEALKIILGLGTSLSGQLLTYDALHSNFFKRILSKNPDCAVCGTNPSITSMPVDESSKNEGVEWSSLEEILANKNKESVLLIDVRTPQEFKEISVQHSINIPLAELSSKMHEHLKLLGQADDLIFICLSGKRSARAVEILENEGLHNVRHLRGGILGRSSDHFLSRST